MNQKKTWVATEQAQERVQKLSWEYVFELMCIAPERLVFVDESGAFIHLARAYGRALSGTRVRAEVPRNRGRATTLIGAIALRGVVSLMTLEGGTTGAVFTNYVVHELAPRLRLGDVVVWDNLAAHKVAAARQAIHAAGADLIFTPPYSPEFNPIELCWAKVKRLLRDFGARTREDLLLAIERAVAQVCTTDITGWFRHCGYLDRQPN